MRRIALVVGGTSGMGAETARQFAQAGIFVIVAGRRAGDAPEGCEAIEIDIADEASVRAGFDHVEMLHGPIAILANFAGTLGSPERTSLADMSVDEWDDVYRVNARGSFLLVREMLRRRREHPVEDGRIILVASAAAQLGSRVSSAAYASSKGAVLALVRTAALEASLLRITVNAIAPGSIRTPMLEAGLTEEMKRRFEQVVPLGRIGMPADVAAAALYLASPQASYVTGSCLDVNGGLRFN